VGHKRALSPCRLSQFVVQVVAGISLDDDHVAASLVPSARTCLDGFGALASCVVFLENVEATDAGHDRETCDAARVHGGPNRLQPHLPAGQARLDALADAEALLDIFVRIELDRAEANRPEAHAQGFSFAPHRSSGRRKGSAVNALRLV
jgi:hypothetical protein